MSLNSERQPNLCACGNTARLGSDMCGRCVREEEKERERETILRRLDVLIDTDDRVSELARILKWSITGSEY
jgi:hypothetical protein